MKTHIIKKILVLFLVMAVPLLGYATAAAITPTGGGGGVNPEANPSSLSAACQTEQASGTSPDCCTNRTDCVDSYSDPAASCTASNCDLVQKYLNPTINLFSAAVGLVVVIAIIVGGIQYSTSAGDSQKAARAKGHIFNAVIALLAYTFLYAFLQFIVPGGILH